MPFQPGETVVRRDTFRGRVWSAHALRVVEDTSVALVAGCFPGAEVLGPTTWIDWLQTGNDVVRKQALPNLASGQWQLGHWNWRDSAHLLWTAPGLWFSINAFYDMTDGRLTNWYINFQKPLRRTRIGYDTFDLLLNLVVAPDLSSWSWKDEDEYTQARKLGVVTESDHRAVDEARAQAITLIETQAGPFAESSGWQTWPVDPTWPTPTLPANALTADLG